MGSEKNATPPLRAKEKDQCFFSIIKMLLFYCILKNNFKLLYTFYLKFKVLVILSCFLMSAVCIGFNIFISVLVILVHQVKLNENQLAYIFCIIYFNSVNVYFILFIDFFID